MNKLIFPQNSKSINMLLRLLDAKDGQAFNDIFIPLAKNYRKLSEPVSGYLFVLEQSFTEVKTTLSLFPMFPIGISGRAVILMYSCMDVNEFNIIKNFVDNELKIGNFVLVSNNSSFNKQGGYIPKDGDLSLKKYRSLCIEYDKGPINNYIISFQLEL
ncbi:hypothetical protein ACF3OC_12395 [Sphingobacterium cellulitidis]|uniref:hypothetical protein n=1 Tax=Sphingobacterium cellulitidis TaxID=1768011 RepID=UPI000B942B50|nr:hypothetical protein CHT99_19395 [Sphingobacterium cellulitidis]